MPSYEAPTAVGVSATLAADEAVRRRRIAGQRVVSLASGEIGLDTHRSLLSKLAAAANNTAYGPVAGHFRLREAVAGYWRRRGMDTDPDQIVAGPGSKPLLFALLLAVGGDVVVPIPSWVSYAAQANLAGATPIGVPIRPGHGGVPDPDALAEAVTAARDAGRHVRAVIVTIPDNPTGAIADVTVVRRLAKVARELDLTIISDEIYRDLVFDGTPVPSPALWAPERSVITTGLTKSLAVGGWRIGVVRLPSRPAGDGLGDRLLAIASQVWSSPAAPVQAAAAHAFDEGEEITGYVAAARRLHATVTGAVADRLTAARAVVAPVRATCYLYPDFERLREPLAARGVRTGTALARLLADDHGVVTIPAAAFGEGDGALRLRAATSQLYGEASWQRNTALTAADPLDLPWIRAALDHITETFTDLAGSVAA